MKVSLAALGCRVLQHGGLARNEDYPYRGINDFCKQNVPEVRFQGESSR